MDIQLDWGFQSLVDQLQDGVFLIEDGRLNYVNDILCEMLGYPREELIGSHFPEFIAEADRDRVIETHRRRLDGENVPSSYRFRILRKDGVETNVSLQVGFTPGGRTVVGTVKDLSQLEETLSEMERLKTALEQIVLKLPDIYYRTDMQGKLVRLSPSVQDILGYPPSEVLGRPITDFYVNGQERIQIVKKILEAKGDVVRVEAPLLHRDGREVWFCTNAYLVLDENNQPIGIEGLARDDTHRKQLEDRLQKRTLELEKSRNDILRLTDFTREINESTDMEHIVDRILKFATEEFQFEGAAVFLLSSDRKHLEFYRGFFPKPEEGINESNLKNLRIPLVKGGGFHAKVFMRKRPLFLPRFRALEENQEIPGLGKSMLHNILIQPLTIRDECIGLMDFTRFTSPLQLNKQDLKKISHFADQIVSAIRNSRLLRETTHARDVMEGEVDLARKVQENLISQRNPDRNIAAVYRPMMAVGGDFYEFLRFRDSGNIGIFVSDVSGHGVAAAFITSMIKPYSSSPGRSPPIREDCYILSTMPWKNSMWIISLPSFTVFMILPIAASPTPTPGTTIL